MRGGVIMNDSALVLNQQLNRVTEGRQFVTFSIDDEEFGIEITRVQEIIGYTKPTHIPNASEFVSGVINLRGVIIPVMDLRKKFHMPEKEYDKFTVIIVLEVSGKTMGIIVDAVSDVLSLNENDIQPPPEFSKFKSEFINGMGKNGEKLVILLDIDKILNYEEIKR
jgi:purine-binding chemotaxis protein CheW